MIGTAGIGLLVVFGIMGIALKGPSHSRAATQELYNTEHKNTADGLAALPGNYDQIPQAKVTQLGAPLPGDLGLPVLQQERQLGVADGRGDFHANAEVDDARAERIRIAQQRRQAHEAGVFFAISRQGTAGAQTVAANAQSATGAVAGEDGPKLNLDLDRDQNNQQRKLDFMNRPASREIYNPYPLQEAASPYEVMAGSIIAASMITGLNSDLPGTVVAQVTENVYDTVTGRSLLIPQGARLIGTYDSVVAFHQSRAVLVWQRLIMPDGSSIQIENLPATDAAGYSGLEDKVDYHTWALLKGVMLSTLLGVGTELSVGQNNSDLVRAIQESTQQNVNRAGQQITQKNLNIQPTITIRPGWPLRVIVHKDLILKPYQG
jgi:type IV secretion system protein VirB10